MRRRRFSLRRRRILISLAVGLMLVGTIFAIMPYRDLIAYQMGLTTVNRAPLPDRLIERGVNRGDPVYIRIFKQERVLELWMRPDAAGAYRLFETYPICAMSGTLGPKTRQGDHQAPEGFYTVKRSQLNPHSSYHLAFNIGYPNAFERAHGYTGDYIMVHGSCVSVGCFAMTDEGIEDIYGLVESALKAGQGNVPVHIFPFRVTDAALSQHQSSPWLNFWKSLKPGFDAFESSKQPPHIQVQNGAYIIAP